MKTHFEWNPKKMIEVELLTNFNVIRETLTRIGILSGNSLYQTCHILHKKGKYYIVHFKEMFAFSGKTPNLTLEDVLRRNYIAKLLECWGLVKIVNPSICELYYNKNLTVLSYENSKKYNLVPKYNLGNSNKVKSAA